MNCTKPFTQLQAYLVYCRRRNFKVNPLPAQRPQECDSTVTFFTIAMLPCIQQVVVVTRLVSEVKILVTV